MHAMMTFPTTRRRLAARAGRVLAAGALLALTLTTTAQAQAVLRFTGAPQGTPEQQAARFEPLGQYLQQRLKLKAQWVPVKSEAAVLTALVSGKADLAWLDAGTLMQAEAYAPGQVRPFLQREEDQKAHSVVIVRAASPVKRLQDLKGRAFSFGPKGSATAFLMPRSALLAAKVDPAKDLASVALAASEEAVVAAVQAGQVEAGALGQATWEALVAARQVDAAAFRVIFTSAPYPDRVLAARADTPEDSLKAIASAFLVLEAVPGGRDILKAQATRRFVEVKPESYAPVRAAAVQAGLLAK
jgi:phosphonate transport system substrate-binding protein